MANNNSGTGLGFSALDIGSMGINIDRLLKLNQALDLDSKFTQG